MKILYFGNNTLGRDVLEWLIFQGEEIVGLVLNPESRRKNANDMIRLSGLPSSLIFDGSRLDDPETTLKLAALKPDLGLSVMFGPILTPRILGLPSRGCLNIHPALLPYNRGAYPNVWSIIEGTPAGVTLHFMDQTIDTGDIVAQVEVPIDPTDTGHTLYHKLNSAAFGLIKSHWSRIADGRFERIPQPTGKGTCHRTVDVKSVDEIDLEKSYKGADLINLIRARTFPPYPGAYFKAGDRKVYLRLELLSEEDLNAKT